MIVKIRLTRNGKKRLPCYRIVVVNSESPRDTGRILQDLGYYQPKNKTVYLRMDTEGYKSWMSQGAQPTGRVLKLFNIAINDEKYLFKRGVNECLKKQEKKEEDSNDNESKSQPAEPTQEVKEEVSSKASEDNQASE